MIRRGVGLITFNRGNYLREFVESILSTVPNDTIVVLCDDGSNDNTAEVARTLPITYLRGVNKGVVANKNRALYLLQECHFICLIEDDLFPTEKGWFEAYETTSIHTGINHFCRVQDKEIEETHLDFTDYMKNELNLTPIYGPSPRGDLTFITAEVLRKVGGLHPSFKGAGYAHGEWAERINKAELIGHPQKWIDVKEARDKFVQKGDTEGGRWNFPKGKIKEELRYNKAVLKQVRALNQIYVPLELP